MVECLSTTLVLVTDFTNHLTYFILQKISVDWMVILELKPEEKAPGFKIFTIINTNNVAN